MESGMYKNAEILDKNKHEMLKVGQIENYKYASKLKDCVISVSEFYAASRSQPIVFAQSDTGEYLAVTLLSLEQNKNHFVNKNGKWKVGEYVPAYVRRYPFVFAKVKDEFALAVDMNCAQVSTEVDGQPIFENGKASAFNDGVMNFLNDHQNDYLRTQAFIQKLADMDVLEEASAQVNQSGESFTVAGFKRINEEKFNALDKEQIFELHHLGYYKLVVAHLMSLHNFGKLLKK